MNAKWTNLFQVVLNTASVLIAALGVKAAMDNVHLNRESLLNTQKHIRTSEEQQRQHFAETLRMQCRKGATGEEE
jgi:hypothetical protein